LEGEDLRTILIDGLRQEPQLPTVNERGSI
jgi:hypothetical protein